MKKQISVVMFIISVLVFNSLSVPAAETESPARAAARKKAEERMKKAAGGSAADSTSGLVELNKATKLQLMKLPGIGEAEADKIIAGRPYMMKTDLRKKEIIPPALFYSIVDKVEIVLKDKPEQKPAVVIEKKKEGKPEKKKGVFEEFKTEKLKAQ
jgi:hypothetical protein